MNRVVTYLQKPIGRVGGALRLVAAVVLLIAAVVFCVTSIDSRDTDSRIVDARTALQNKAGSVVSDVFSVDARSWSSDRETARSLVAPPLSVSSSKALTGPPPNGASSVSWVPQNVGVTWADDTGGEALIVVRVTVTSRSGLSESRVKSVQASFTRSGDRWLLSGLEELQ
ncbi:hypothetical protein [Gordonia hydrophobica]|uniref:Mce-associated membrane protein n=1 Tax=Gordonia hydrophobica TaxID=40516 RepID=A0ABZ2TXE3_9ACTN|nr:hypothetical protein [Gordonia hydrophobica]MBM7365778.1 hypothetical protein [Gordonia hydrophobica]